MSKKKKPGTLSEDDKVIWQKVTETITPLEDRPAAKPLPPLKQVHLDHSNRPLPAEWEMFGGPAPEKHIDRKKKRRISTGQTDIDRVLDLHGSTSDVAYDRLQQEIINSIKMGHSCILVITGKGGKHLAQTEGGLAQYRKRDEFKSGTGVLKRLVPEWLSSPQLRPYVISFDSASPSHGGDGALYVMLRKKAPGRKK